MPASDLGLSLAHMSGFAATRYWDADYCFPMVKLALAAKARHTVPPTADRGDVLLHCVTSLTPKVSK